MQRCAGVYWVRDVAKDEAGEVSSGQTMINLVGHITQFGLYRKSNGKTIKTV